MNKYYENELRYKLLCEIFVAHSREQVRMLIEKWGGKGYEYKITNTSSEYTLIFTKSKYYIVKVEREPTWLEKLIDRILVR